VLTSNRTRELSDALRRRCLFFWLPYPALAEEVAILHARVPGLADRLAAEIARAMQVFRSLPLQKAPGVAESLDWARALISLHRDHLDAAALEQTLGCVHKVHEDQRPGRARAGRTQPGHRLRVRLGLKAKDLISRQSSVAVARQSLVSSRVGRHSFVGRSVRSLPHGE
jgi:MoxR-like ATPase